MESRHHHSQSIAAAKGGFSERTGRRIEMEQRQPSPPPGDRRRARNTADPFHGLWDSEIRPMLEAEPGLRSVTLLEEMQRRHPDHDWDRLRRSGSGAKIWCQRERSYTLRIGHAVSTAFQIPGAVGACFGSLARLNWLLRMRWRSSMPAMVIFARRSLLKPSMGPILAFTPR